MPSHGAESFPLLTYPAGYGQHPASNVSFNQHGHGAEIN